MKESVTLYPSKTRVQRCGAIKAISGKAVKQEALMQAVKARINKYKRG